MVRRGRPTRRVLIAAIALVVSVLTLVPASPAAADDVTIMEIQGAGHLSPFDGETVTTTGVITAVGFRQFYIQDPDGDGDDLTSDGILVRVPAPDGPGAMVSVTGVVDERVFGTDLSSTVINSASVSVLSTGHPLPEPVEIGRKGKLPSPTTVISDDELPVDLGASPGLFDPDEDAIDFWEALEGMRVEIDQPTAVSGLRTFNPFSSEVFTLPSRGSRAVIEPDDARTRRGGIELQPSPSNTGDQNPERVQIQFDGTFYPGPVPLIKVGDDLPDVTGVVGYSFGNFEVNATEIIDVKSKTLRPETSQLRPTGRSLTVASYNVLNLSADGSDVGQYANIAAQIADNLRGPDIIAVQEIQDDSGQTDDGTTTAAATLAALVDAIAAAGGPTYASFDVAPADGSSGGIPGGNIRNAFLYNPDRVSLVDFYSLTPAALALFGADPAAFDGTRDPLVGVFDYKGNEVTVINNHLTSRFGSTPVFGAIHPFVQAGETERGNETQALNDVVDSMLAADPGALITVVGDLNTFQWTDELTDTLPGPEGVLSNLLDVNLDRSDRDDKYSFIFEGNSQMLDHIFVSDGLLAAKPKMDIVHVNVDFPRVADDFASDHEPLLARFDLSTVRTRGDFTLQILHASDLEGGVDALDRAANFAAIIDGLEDRTDVDATVRLSAGDNYIPGPFFSAAGDRSVFRDGGVFNDVYSDLFGATYDSLREGGGRVDVSIMNAIGFDASAIGNHEFDAGSDAMESIIEEDFRSPAGPASDRWVGAQFPYLSANLDFSGDGDLGNLFTGAILPNTAFESGVLESASNQTSIPKIAPATFVDVGGGEKVGVVGLTTPLLDTISSPTGTTVIGPTTNDMPALAAVAQPTIDALTSMGIDKIVVVSHLQQLALEQELATLLSGVDVIIAGGSDTLLADPDDDLLPGDVAAGPYPVVTRNADGNTTAIVSTDGEYGYVGQLTVSFTEKGRVINDFDPAENGPVASTEDNAVAAHGGGDPFATGSKGEITQRLVDAVTGVVIAKDGNVFGETDVFMEGRREFVRTEETNFGHLSALANLAAAQTLEAGTAVSIKNGGGIRAEIGEVLNVGGVTTLIPPQANPISGRGEGEVSQLAIENSLRFNNGLTLLTLTATELAAVIEHSVAATAPGATPGQFGHYAGLRFSFDPSQPVGSRVQNAAIVDEDTGAIVDPLIVNGSIAGDPARTIRIVTLNFLADGGDAYPFPTGASAARVDLFGVLTDPGVATFAAPGTEQDALAEFLAANHGIGAGTPYAEAETAPADDVRIQNLSVRGDTIFP